MPKDFTKLHKLLLALSFGAVISSSAATEDAYLTLLSKDNRALEVILQSKTHEGVHVLTKDDRELFIPFALLSKQSTALVND